MIESMEHVAEADLKDDRLDDVDRADDFRFLPLREARDIESIADNEQDGGEPWTNEDPRERSPDVAAWLTEGFTFRNSETKSCESFRAEIECSSGDDRREGEARFETLLQTGATSYVGTGEWAHLRSVTEHDPVSGEITTHYFERARAPHENPDDGGTSDEQIVADNRDPILSDLLRESNAAPEATPVSQRDEVHVFQIDHALSVFSMPELTHPRSLDLVMSNATTPFPRELHEFWPAKSAAGEMEPNAAQRIHQFVKQIPESSGRDRVFTSPETPPSSLQGKEMSPSFVPQKTAPQSPGVSSRDERMTPEPERLPRGMPPSPRPRESFEQAPSLAATPFEPESDLHDQSTHPDLRTPRVHAAEQGGKEKTLDPSPQEAPEVPPEEVPSRTHLHNTLARPAIRRMVPRKDGRKNDRLYERNDVEPCTSDRCRAERSDTGVSSPRTRGPVRIGLSMPLKSLSSSAIEERHGAVSDYFVVPQPRDSSQRQEGLPIDTLGVPRKDERRDVFEMDSWHGGQYPDRAASPSVLLSTSRRREEETPRDHLPSFLKNDRKETPRSPTVRGNVLHRSPVQRETPQTRPAAARLTPNERHPRNNENDIHRAVEFTGNNNAERSGNAKDQEDTQPQHLHDHPLTLSDQQQRGQPEVSQRVLAEPPALREHVEVRHESETPLPWRDPHVAQRSPALITGTERRPASQERSPAHAERISTKDGMSPDRTASPSVLLRASRRREEETPRDHLPSFPKNDRKETPRSPTVRGNVLQTRNHGNDEAARRKIRGASPFFNTPPGHAGLAHDGTAIASKRENASTSSRAWSSPRADVPDVPKAAENTLDHNRRREARPRWRAHEHPSTRDHRSMTVSDVSRENFIRAPKRDQRASARSAVAPFVPNEPPARPLPHATTTDDTPSSTHRGSPQTSGPPPRGSSLKSSLPPARKAHA